MVANDRTEWLQTTERNGFKRPKKSHNRLRDLFFITNFALVSQGDAPARQTHIAGIGLARASINNE
mgnify:CR=1